MYDLSTENKTKTLSVFINRNEKGEQVKRLLPIVLCVCFALTCFGAVTAFAAERTQIYLGEKLPVGAGSAAFQPMYVANDGCSAVRYALEMPCGNKFVRMANFDGSYLCNYTALAVACSPAAANTVTVSLNYRLYEGEPNYAEDSVVCSVSFRGGCRQFTYADLAANVNGHFSWQTLDVSLTTDDALSSAYVVVEFYFASASGYATGRTCFDVDNVSVVSDGKELCVGGGFDGAKVSASDALDTDYALTDEAIAAAKALTLASDKISYRVNTVYDNSLSVNFDLYGGARSLPSAKSDSLYTDAASGSQFVVYDSQNANAFLRIGNFDATKSNPLVRMPFADNETGGSGNIPKTTNIYVNFNYRLYVEDDVLRRMDDSDIVLEMSTRRSTLNNSGKFTLDNLVVNEHCDPTWRSISCVLQTNISSTAFMELIFYSQTAASFSSGTYIDIDNMYVSDQPSGKNYACDNGTWESALHGFVTGGENPMCPSLTFNANYGKMSAVNFVSGTNYEMLVPAGGTFGVLYGKNATSGVYDLTFDIAANVGDKIKLLFDGRSGGAAEITVGQNVQTDNVAATWQQTDNGYKCFVTYAKYDGRPLSRVDLVNLSVNTVHIDNLFVGQVASVCTTAGDYASFSAELSRLTALSQLGNYNKTSLKNIDSAIYDANKLDEFASQRRMDEAIEAVSSAINGATAKADLIALYETLARAEETMTNGKSYTKTTKVLLMESYFAAKHLTEQSAQSDVDSANAKLTEAMNNLAEYNNALTVAVVGGISVAIVAAIVFRRKENGNEN